MNSPSGTFTIFSHSCQVLANQTHFGYWDYQLSHEIKKNYLETQLTCTLSCHWDRCECPLVRALGSLGTRFGGQREAWGRCNKKKEADRSKFPLSLFSSSKALNSFLCPFAVTPPTSLSVAGSWGRTLEKIFFLWICSFQENVPQWFLLHQGDKDIILGVQRLKKLPSFHHEVPKKILLIKTVNV